MKYRLTEKIGSGGMAEVFLAEAEGPEGFERTFVVKQIHPRLSDAAEFVRMFVDEAKISARLHHPNIVQVFEFVYQAGSYYLAMEPVDGVDMQRLLTRLIARREVAPPVFVAEVAHQACLGLEYAHSLTDADGKPLGIVHRDVTPPNVMVSWVGTVKLLDFGLARAVREIRTNLTETGTVKGKMSYVAPELLQGRTADARADVFSLGVVMHELLTGQRLFTGENDMDTFKRVLEMPIPHPHERNRAVKPVLDAIVMRALERDPDRRFQTAREMGDKLEAFVLRTRFSNRQLVKTLRELVPPEDVPPGAETAGAGEGQEAGGGGGASGNVNSRSGSGSKPGSHPGTPGNVGQSGTVMIREPTPSRSRPPAIPAAAAAAASTRPHRRRLWLAAALPAALAGALAATMLRRPAGLPALDASAIRTVTISFDSVPQGAVVTAGGSASLGETPVLLKLPRGDAPVELVLSKPGFVVTTFKVIPNRDKEAAAVLLPDTEKPRPAPEVAASAEDSAGIPTVATRSQRRRRSHRRDSATPAATAPSPATSPAPPPGPPPLQPASLSPGTTGPTRR
jgi:serine/threonine protein kinase